MKQNHILSLALAASLAACGGTSDPNELVEAGIHELRSGDSGSAAATLDRALSLLEATDPDYVRAHAGMVEALAAFEPERARDHFLVFAKEQPELATADLFQTVSQAMFKVGAKVEAVAVLDAACLRFPQDSDLAAIKDELGLRAQDKATPDELAQLESLGYLGGD